MGRRRRAALEGQETQGPSASSLKHFRRILGYVWPQKRYVVPALVCIILQAVVYSASIGSVLPILYAMIQPEGVHGWVYTHLAEHRHDADLSVYSSLKNRRIPGVPDGALMVSSLDPDSPLYRAGVRDGDHILSANGKSEDPVEMFRELSGSAEVEVRYVPSGTTEVHTARVRGDSLGLTYGLLARIVEWLPGGWNTPQEKLSTLTALLIGLMGLVVAGSVTKVLSEYLAAIAIGRAMVDLRRQMYTHMFRLPLSQFSQNTTDTISKYFQDMNDIVRGLENFFQKIVTEPFKAIGVTALALYLNWQLTLAVMLGVPVAAVLFRYLGKKVRRANKKLLVGYGQMLGVLESTMTGMRVVKGYMREGYECRRLFGIDRHLLRQQLKMSFIEALTSPFIETMGFMVAAGAILYFANGMYSHGVKPPELMVMLICLGGIFDPVRKLSTVYPKIQRANAAADRIFDLVDAPSEYEQDAGRPRLAPFRSGITFEDVIYTYPGANRPALNGVSLQVRKGEIIALVGPNGSGKTTLVSLLPRFFPVTSGRILIDGQDISQVSLRSLRANFSLIAQESVIFPDTVRANISYGRPDATQAEIEEAARRAFADEFIQQLPHGYDTVIGEHGATLSGGQRQRIAIARAILRDAPILIFDEATSQVDPESEMKIHEALESFLQERTAFIIAHRYSTVSNADRIVVMEDGQVAAVGTHAHLLKTCELYRRLYETQFRAEDRPQATGAGEKSDAALGAAVAETPLG
jgi:subfamily B ATP-binding cassette protein MsbA